jgi:catechol 2,3-dioxygenase-like lactoylglutathione lyase family enzyme
MTVRAVLVPVKDLTRSLPFWTEGLRAREVKRGVEKGLSWAHLAWHSPMPRGSLDIILSETESRIGPSHLDKAGFNCLAFLSNDLLKDRLRLMGLGALEAGEPSDHVVDGKPLKISFIKGPDGELVELIEMERISAVRHERGAA